MRRAVAAIALAVVGLGITGCVDLLADPPAPAPPSAMPSAPPTPWPSAAAEVVVVADSGAVEHAAGPATQTAEGVHDDVVTTGDTPSAIADRFGVCTLDVILGDPQQDPWPLADQTIVVSRVTDIPLDTHDCRFDVDQLPWR